MCSASQRPERKTAALFAVGWCTLRSPLSANVSFLVERSGGKSQDACNVPICDVFMLFVGLLWGAGGTAATLIPTRWRGGGPG